MPNCSRLRKASNSNNGTETCFGLQVCQPNGEVIITNDGATILKQMQLTQPAAKMLVELSKSQVSHISHVSVPIFFHPMPENYCF